MVVIVWQLALQLYMQSVQITSKAMSLILAIGEVYSTQYYVIKLVNWLRQVGGLLSFLHQ